MNDSGESREETVDKKMEVLSAKTKTRIGFRNVRTMYEGDPRTHGVEQWKRSSRPSITPGASFRSWPRTDRSGVPLLLPYMHASRHDGHE